MRLIPIFLMMCLIMPWQGAAQLAEAPETPELQVTVSPESALKTQGYAHGQLVVRIQLFSRHPFEELSLKPPSFVAADVVELVRPRTRKISGYAGQGYLYETAMAVIPHDPGPFLIPAVTAVGVVEPTKNNDLRFDLASAPITLTISGPPPAYDAEWWLASPRVEVDETWSKPVEDIRVGEIVQRKVSLRVWGLSAERLPVLTHPPAQGVRISLRNATSRTETSSEGLIAHADYVWDIEVERQQVVFLKPIGVSYWDTTDHSQRASSAPAHRLEPLPTDSEAVAAKLMREAVENRDETRSLALAAGLVLIAPLVMLAGVYISASLPTQADRRLKKACREDAKPEAMYNALDHWLTASGLRPGETSVRLPARRELSDHLFARDHPSANARRKLIGQAFGWSRRVWIRLLTSRIGLFGRANSVC